MTTLAAAMLLATGIVQVAAEPAFSGPQLANPDDVIRVEDYPAAAIRRGEQGRTRLAVTVEPSGRVVACVVTQSSGSALLDETGCRVMRRHARFRSAMIDDKPTFGVLLTNTSFIMPSPGSTPSLPRMSDVSVGVSRLPGTARALSIDVERRVAADGSIISCHVVASGAAAAYDRLACRHAGELPIDRIRTQSGDPVAGVLTETVKFVLTSADSRPGRARPRSEVPDQPAAAMIDGR